MIIEDLKRKEDFSESEKIVADYILEHIASIIDLTAEQLGVETFTSKTTVLRLCKKLNMKGYKDFQKELNYEYISESSATKDLYNRDYISSRSTIRDIAAALPGIYGATIKKVQATIDFNQIRRVVKKLIDCPYIEIYGVGATFAMAEDFAFKFRTTGKNCYALNGFNEHAIEMGQKYKNKPVALILSFSGGNIYMCQIAGILKKNGYYVIGIGGDAIQDLKEVSSEYIKVDSRDLILSLEVITIYVSLQYILDILFVSLLASDYDKNLEGAIEVYKGKYLYKGKDFEE